MLITTYQGIQSWFHIVLFREDFDSTCGTNLQAGNVNNLSSQTSSEPLIYTPDPATQPIQVNRAGF